MRPERRTFLRVLIASPADTAEERAAATRAIKELNKLHGQREGFVLEPLLWEEDSYPGLGVDAQDVINRELDDYQILIGIMKTRFGTPTHRADSGTEEEFDRALDRSLTHPNEIRILFYFHNAVIKFLELDIEQAVKVHAFRRRIQAQGLLVKDYGTIGEFERAINSDLLKVVRDLLRPPTPTKSLGQGASKTATPPISQGSWHAAYRKSAPQGASHRSISIAQYGRSPIRLAGIFQSDSSYFRFGFKLMGFRGRGFSAGSVQSDDQNLLVHIGRNVASSDVLLTHYQNGLRMSPFAPILQYEDCRKLPIELSITAEYAVILRVEHNIVFEAYIAPEIKAQVMILAWGDEHDYVVEFSNIMLYIE